METVAFYSYKGGVGRSLLVANTARFLAMSGKRVVALDLDFEAPGLHEKLGDRALLQRAMRGELFGAVELLRRIVDDDEREDSAASLELADVVSDVPVRAAKDGRLMLIPAGSAPSKAYWSRLSRLQSALKLATEGEGLAEAVLELKARIARDLMPHYLLIDARTGITELGGLATSLLADHVVCLTTNSPESVRGIEVVAEALRESPRLKGQSKLKLSFVLSRVEENSGETVKEIRDRLGKELAVLPHDSGVATAEHLYGTVAPKDSQKTDRESVRNRLFPATLEWIAKTFPNHSAGAQAARLRMEKVEETWSFMTRSTEYGRGWSGSRTHWPFERLNRSVRFQVNKSSSEWREADIVAYDSPVDLRTSKAVMVIEFVDTEDSDDVARWWLKNSDAKVVVLLRKQSERKMYSSAHKYSHHLNASARWDIPMPEDFEGLLDPCDISADALVDAVQRGHDYFLGRLVREWSRASLRGLHGGAPWRPSVAKKILDGLASVTQPDIARRILWATSLHSPSRIERFFNESGDDAEQVRAELFSPLLWRLPPKASVEALREGGQGKMMPHHGMGDESPLTRLSVVTVGLCYDPDRYFRQAISRPEMATNVRAALDDDEVSDIGTVSRSLEFTELSFAFDDGDSPFFEKLEKNDRDSETAKLPSLRGHIIQRMTQRKLTTHGLLSFYDVQKGCVTLYERAIKYCSERLSLQERHVGSVVLLHTTILALAHVGRDLDGRLWGDFSLPCSESSLLGTNSPLTTLVQVFTHRYLLSLDDAALLNAFERLSEHQPPSYRGWKALRKMPLEDARNWFMCIRRGIGAQSPWAVKLEDDAPENL